MALDSWACTKEFFAKATSVFNFAPAATPIDLPLLEVFVTVDSSGKSLPGFLSTNKLPKKKWGEKFLISHKMMTGEKEVFEYFHFE